MKKTILTAAAALSLIVACKTSSKTGETKPSAEAPKINCGEPLPRYGTVIKPLLANQCIGCHGSSGPAAGLNLTDLEEVKKIAANGDFLGVIKYKSGYPGMPKNAPKLDDKTIAQVECWINNGMPI